MHRMVPAFQSLFHPSRQPVRVLRQVAEQMDLPAPNLVPTGQLHPANHANPIPFSQLFPAVDACHGIVVGEGYKIQAGTSGIKYQLIHPHGTIRKTGVAMQITDHPVRPPTFAAMVQFIIQQLAQTVQLNF